MAGDILVADWYYIGHYGQLGPLTREQIDELVQGGVISRETFVWRSGMTDWMPADRVSELGQAFRAAEPFVAPPPPPVAPPRASSQPLGVSRPYGTDMMLTSGYLPLYDRVKSDRSRMAGGVLNLLVPGVGRMYLGYYAYGVLQLVLSLCMVGWVWSFIDGIIILSGGVKYDGYGRLLEN